MHTKENIEFIPLSVPNFSGREKQLVSEAVESEWVSTGGSLINDFEAKIAEYTNMKRAVAANSGTSALHLAMIVAGIGKGDEVIAPALTFIAAINPIRYAGAEPVFIGCDDYLCIDPDGIEEFCQTKCEMKNGSLYNKTTNARVKAVVAVHVFGNLANMERIMEIAQKYNLIVVEDATEALGSYYTEGLYKGKMAGTIGDIAAYSFNGNKLITTGAGGMLVSNHAEWAAHAKHLSTQAKDDELNFIHNEIGYNYRLTNLQAALGLAQMEQIENFIKHKHCLYDLYKERLCGKNGYKILDFQNNIRSNKWFFSLICEDEHVARERIIEVLGNNKIQSRPVWALINEQKPYFKNEAYCLDKAVYYREKIVNIPCSTNLSISNANRVCDVLLGI